MFKKAKHTSVLRDSTAVFELNLLAGDHVRWGIRSPRMAGLGLVSFPDL